MSNASLAKMFAIATLAHLLAGFLFYPGLTSEAASISEIRASGAKSCEVRVIVMGLLAKFPHSGNPVSQAESAPRPFNS
jgi:hypothetical protein